MTENNTSPDPQSESPQSPSHLEKHSSENKILGFIDFLNKYMPLKISTVLASISGFLLFLTKFLFHIIKILIMGFQKRISNLTNKYFISTLAALALLGGVAALLIPSYTNLFREPGYTSPLQDSTKENPEKAQSTPTPTASPTGNKAAEVEQKSTSDLRLHLLYITGGIIAILGLIETNRKNSQDHIRQVHADRRNRYIEAVDKLSSEKASVRLGGVYSLVSLADEWIEDDNLNRETRVKEGQVIINNLCSYIRSPFPLADKFTLLEKRALSVPPPMIRRKKKTYSPELLQKSKKDEITFKEEREIRLAIIQEIQSRLSGGLDSTNKPTPGPWSKFTYDFSGNFFYPVDLSNSYFEAPINFSLSNFFEFVNFSSTFFNDDADFMESSFRGDTFFEKSIFNADVRFRGAAFTEGTDFSQATFKGGADFSKSSFNGRVLFLATFCGYTTFSEATFSQDVQFTGITFHQKVDFSKSTFKELSVFIGVFFKGETNFSDVTFAKSVNFSEATFNNDAGFVETTFNHEAHFSKTTFNNKTHFGKAAFNNGAYFGKATFNNDAYFGKVAFTQNTDFSAATFTGEVYFRDAKFTGKAYFGGAKFIRCTSFEGAYFEKYAPIFADDSGAARFSNRVNWADSNFSVRYGSQPIELGSATLGDKTFSIPFGTVVFDPGSWDEETEEYTHMSVTCCRIHHSPQHQE